MSNRRRFRNTTSCKTVPGEQLEVRRVPTLQYPVMQDIPYSDAGTENLTAGVNWFAGYAKPIDYAGLNQQLSTINPSNAAIHFVPSGIPVTNATNLAASALANSVDHLAITYFRLKSYLDNEVARLNVDNLNLRKQIAELNRETRKIAGGFEESSLDALGQGVAESGSSLWTAEDVKALQAARKRQEEVLDNNTRVVPRLSLPANPNAGVSKLRAEVMQKAATLIPGKRQNEQLKAIRDTAKLENRRARALEKVLEESAELRRVDSNLVSRSVFTIRETGESFGQDSVSRRQIHQAASAMQASYAPQKLSNSADEQIDVGGQKQTLGELGLRALHDVETANGTRVVVIEDLKTRDVYFTIRGTYSGRFISDMADNVLNYRGLPTFKDKEVIEIVSGFSVIYSDRTQFVTGHSQGGELANLVSMHTGIPSITLNPAGPGINHHYQESWFAQHGRDPEGLLHNYVVKGDIVEQTYSTEQSGNIIRAIADGQFFSLMPHSKPLGNITMIEPSSVRSDLNGMVGVQQHLDFQALRNHFGDAIPTVHGEVVDDGAEFISPVPAAMRSNLLRVSAADQNSALLVPSVRFLDVATSVQATNPLSAKPLIETMRINPRTKRAEVLVSSSAVPIWHVAGEGSVTKVLPGVMRNQVVTLEQDKLLISSFGSSESAEVTLVASGVRWVTSARGKIYFVDKAGGLFELKSGTASEIPQRIAQNIKSISSDGQRIFVTNERGTLYEAIPPESGNAAVKWNLIEASVTGLLETADGIFVLKGRSEVYQLSTSGKTPRLVFREWNTQFQSLAAGRSDAWQEFETDILNPAATRRRSNPNHVDTSGRRVVVDSDRNAWRVNSLTNRLEFMKSGTDWAEVPTVSEQVRSIINSPDKAGVLVITGNDRLIWVRNDQGKMMNKEILRSVRQVRSQDDYLFVLDTTSTLRRLSFNDGRITGLRQISYSVKSFAFQNGFLVIERPGNYLSLAGRNDAVFDSKNWRVLAGNVRQVLGENNTLMIINTKGVAWRVELDENGKGTWVELGLSTGLSIVGEQVIAGGVSASAGGLFGQSLLSLNLVDQFWSSFGAASVGG